jgi:N-acetylmuramoyl-L-alanine amidase
MMRAIKRHIIHASASPKNRDIGVKEITKWHQERGFKTVGYHYVIRRDGTIETGRPLEQIGAHVQGHNKDSIGTCLVGAGLSMADFTPEQLNALKGLHEELARRFPNLTLHGHREYANKSCPGFNVRDLIPVWYPPFEAPKPKPLTMWQRMVQALTTKKV